MSRILVIDDDPGVRDSTARLLRGAGYTVDTVGSGEEGVDVEGLAVRAVFGGKLHFDPKQIADLKAQAGGTQMTQCLSRIFCSCKSATSSVA